VTGALDSGVVKLHLGNFISEHDFDKTRFKVEDRKTKETEWVEADVILAADGVKSKARAAILARNGQIDEGESSVLHPSEFQH